MSDAADMCRDVAVLRVRREQAIAYRLHVNNLTQRLTPGSLLEAARYGLQDSAPRDALVGIHARMDGTGPDDWQDDRLIQTYAPRRAVYVLPREDFGIFTLGCLPSDPDERARIDLIADDICRRLDGAELKGSSVVIDRVACHSGRIALRWTTSALYVREVDRPMIDVEEARQQLCRRHLQAFAPTTPQAYAWWTALSRPDAQRVWDSIADELIEVDYEGHRAWVPAADEERLRTAPAPEGARLLVPSDLRLFGPDRLRLFVGPGLARISDVHDSFHPGGVLLDGRIVGAWGRHGGTVEARYDNRLSKSARQAIEAEALAMPIPGATMIFEER
jgi:hypothetical protein